MAIPDDLVAWRKAQRARLVAARRAVAPEQRRAWSDVVTRLLIEELPLLQWMTVGIYWPFQGEFDPRFAIRALRECGARAALPVVVGKGMPLQFRLWWPGVSMSRGVFGLPAPQATPIVRPHALLIPPVGFDAQGYRLGYGGGYFDRTLAAHVPQPLKIGVGFELSRIATIYPQPHDIPMDFIVTEAGIHRIGSAGLERIDAAGAAMEHAERVVLDRERAADRTDPATHDDRAAAPDPARPWASPTCYACEPDPAAQTLEAGRASEVRRLNRS